MVLRSLSSKSQRLHRSFAILQRRLLALQTAATSQNSLQSPSASASILAPARGLVPEVIWARMSAQLHLRRGHPLCMLREAIEAHFHAAAPGIFHTPRGLSPVVSASACFDDLLVPADHPSRAESDTYYLDEERTTLLRAHMTAHDVALLRDGHRAFISTGDVYRRDTVDRTHYPVFHQVDGVRLFDGMASEAVVEDLRSVLEGLARVLFGTAAEMRWVDGDFPFTSPSMELEVQWGGEWLEVLGCGELRRGVLERGGVSNPATRGWAFGLGLERLAMVLFGIPDIRLFWSEDPRFHEQFAAGDMSTRFTSYSVYPPVCKDVSFWVDELGRFHENDVHEVAREVAGDLVERVECVDEFLRAGRTSLCFRVTFRSMDRSLTHDEVNELYHEVRTRLSARLPVTLR
jgi:phenylalanyl-tRNA synthetase alpha chain